MTRTEEKEMAELGMTPEQLAQRPAPQACDNSSGQSVINVPSCVNVPPAPVDDVAERPAPNAAVYPVKEPDGISMEEAEGIAAGLADVTAGQVKPFAQIQAELRAEHGEISKPPAPVDDVVERMLKVYFAFAGPDEDWEPEKGMAAAFAVAREGMYSLEQIEAALRAHWDGPGDYGGADTFAQDVLARLKGEKEDGQ